MKWYEWCARLLGSRQKPALAVEHIKVAPPVSHPNPRPVRVEPEQLPPLPFSQSYYPPAYPQQESPGVVFTDPATREQREILDARGRFVDFPGIDRTGLEADAEVLDRMQAHPVVRYRAEFSRFGRDSYLICWMIQPDGRYWADENGFGGTSDPEICLYALLDREGNYRGPFRRYKVGSERNFWTHPVMRLRKEPNTRYVQEGRIVEWIASPEDLSDETALQRLPQPQVYVYQMKDGFSVMGRDYTSISQLTSQKAEENSPFYIDAWGRRVLWLCERFPCFDEFDYEHENRYYNWFYLCGDGVLWHVFYADGSEYISVTRDVNLIDSTVWHRLKDWDIVSGQELELLLWKE